MNINNLLAIQTAQEIRCNAQEGIVLDLRWPVYQMRPDLQEGLLKRPTKLPENRSVPPLFVTVHHDAD